VKYQSCHWSEKLAASICTQGGHLTVHRIFADHKITEASDYVRSDRCRYFELSNPEVHLDN